ncbi:type A2 lantipeptide [Streptomyces sp. TR06-5]|uniref:type A2 lantipeptide n=1 Tax=Streptomyces sp. TR06-5 TaxID=3385976 RepID=UPI0039A1297B
MREHIETAEIADTELDNVSGGLLEGAMSQVTGTVENVVGVDLGGVATDLGGVGVMPETGIAPQTGISL